MIEDHDTVHRGPSGPGDNNRRGTNGAQPPRVTGLCSTGAARGSAVDPSRNRRATPVRRHWPQTSHFGLEVIQRPSPGRDRWRSVPQLERVVPGRI